MNERPSFQELSEKVLIRRRMLDEARRSLDHGLSERSARLVIDVLERVQDNDEAILGIHRECLALLEHAGKIIRFWEETRPPATIVVGSPPNSDPGEKP
jgi:hypothetical protein